MTIEDHYGDYSEIFYQSKNGDIVINKETSEIGIIEKSWTRINVKTEKIDSTDLYNFATKAGYNSNIKLYRIKRKLEVMDINKIEKLFNEKKIELILDYRN
ncbi:hypothetical protein IVB69_01910 [Flavobacterium sp. J49]|uniref:hypothetical protein n=1 Tax=Flavobacterium sp. J49 TaxID=2718534 RepID=UPI001593FDE3|nr:hypothetical protein [Flavobacterium sp. J49]MBF6640226.1 hypothetical protein [Flavobacterium sp. J49]NIC01471.1 hypothetical protein [Flavobacterium sp. J49]